MNLRSGDYLSMRPVVDWLAGVAAGHVKGVILDYGCGNQPYRSLFEGRGERYITADIAQNADASVDLIVAPGERLPLTDASVDTVLSTQVLEHVGDPLHYLSEASRVLRNGGALILTCPASYMLHEEPHDYFRFTRFGLDSLLARSGLEVVRIDTAGGAWRLIGQILINHIVFGRRHRVPVLTGVVHRIAVPASNILFALLDRINCNAKDPVNYMLIAKARKKE